MGGAERTVVAVQGSLLEGLKRPPEAGKIQTNGRRSGINGSVKIGNKNKISWEGLEMVKIKVAFLRPFSALRIWLAVLLDEALSLP